VDNWPTERDILARTPVLLAQGELEAAVSRLRCLLNDTCAANADARWTQIANALEEVDVLRCALTAALRRAS
jgi:hypothetical protein